MSFEKAARLKLRFNSSRGLLSVEDLWDLQLQELNSLAKALKKTLKEAEEEDFLEDVSAEDVITKIKFDLVLYILNTKKEENKARLMAKENKAKREKILELIASKQDEEQKGKSIEELQAELAKLD